jgi:hypothetical protein
MARGHSNLHKFPLQYPTCADHSLWKAAISRINSLFYTFPTPLGRYIDLPHKRFLGSQAMAATSSINKSAATHTSSLIIQRDVDLNQGKYSASPTCIRGYHPSQATQASHFSLVCMFAFTHGQICFHLQHLRVSFGIRLDCTIFIACGRTSVVMAMVHGFGRVCAWEA